MANENRIPKRSEQDPAVCWNTADLFPSNDDWEKDFSDAQSLTGEMAAYEGRLGESAATLYTYLSRNEEIDCRLNRMAVYAFIRNDEDTANPVQQSMKGRFFSYLVQLSSATSFAGPELVAIPEETLEQFYQDEPRLEKYRRFLTKARLGKEHILSPEQEGLLAAAGDLSGGPSAIFNAFTDADMRFPDVLDSEGKAHELTNGSYIALVDSPDRVLRENTFRTFYGVFNANRNSLAAMLNAEVHKDVFFAKARKYSSSLESALQPVEVPVAVYHNLIKAVHENMDKMHRYIDLRRKVMGLDELHMYDVYTPMVPDAKRDIPFAQAKEYVLGATRVLGEEYGRILSESFDQRWMDIYENVGKCSGAYSIASPVHPYVLINYKNNLNSAFTLAHEMGHAMHGYLSYKYQPQVYADYVIFVAEVASTCNEALLMRYLLGQTTDKKERAVLINYFLEQFRTTLYRQTMFAEFELQIQEMAEKGETLTAETMCKLYYDLNKLYYGENMVVDQEIEMEWCRIPHFYRHFYVYQYATGFSAAIALSKRILEGGESAVEDYLSFLKGGCSTDPISLLKMAGVDISTPQPVEEALSLFGELIGELEELLTK